MLTLRNRGTTGAHTNTNTEVLTIGSTLPRVMISAFLRTSAFPRHGARARAQRCALHPSEGGSPRCSLTANLAPHTSLAASADVPMAGHMGNHALSHTHTHILSLGTIAHKGLTPDFGTFARVCWHGDVRMPGYEYK